MSEQPPTEAEGTYHVFVYEAEKPRGGLRDLVASVATLFQARQAVDKASGPSRRYHIVTVHPETHGLVVVESGGFTARSPRKINVDPNDPDSVAWAAPEHTPKK